MTRWFEGRQRARSGVLARSGRCGWPLWTGLVLLMLASPLATWAQGDAGGDVKERARARFMEGREHFAAGRLALALTAFQEANAIKPTPLMLSNIAQVYESMEDFPRAIETLERYVATGKADAEAKAHLARLQADLATWPVITLSTQPAGAEVRVTGAAYPARCETTPCTIPLPPGMRTLRFTLNGFQPAERTVRFAKGQTLSFPPVALAAMMGTVTIRTAPPGAKVTIDGGAPGVSPFTQTLALGPHTARATQEGYGPSESAFTVTETHTASAPLLVDLALEKGVVVGLLEVTVDTDDAEVLVDGKPAGRTPLAGPLSMSPGIHRIQVEAKGAAPYEEVVTIEAGKTERTRIELERTGGGFSLNQRTVSYGLMGLGAAALVGAGITGALALGTSGDLDDCRADASCRRTSREVGLADDVRSGALTTDILLGAGVAIAAAGVVLFLVDRPSAPATEGSVDSGPSVSLVPTWGGAAASATVHF